MQPVALTIAGSDPSGGAGLQADLKTFHQHQVFGTTVVTLITVQNTRGVTAVEHLPAQLVADQLTAVLSDVPPTAIKTGALGTPATMEVVAEELSRAAVPVVVDPVMISKHGHPLLDDDAVEMLARRILPTAWLVTPNRHEAERLTGRSIHDQASMVEAARRLLDHGCRQVLIKGGQLEGQSIDLLWCDDQPHWIQHPRIETTATHGSGCVLSAAITARLAHGEPVLQATEHAIAFVREAIRQAPGLGSGVGPTQMLVAPPGFRNGSPS